MNKIAKSFTIVTFAGLAAVGCMGKTPGHQQASPASATIGTAEMLKGGTIVVRLHGKEGGKMREIKYELKPDDQGYQAFKKNIGGIKVGEKKPIYPPPEAPCPSPSIGSARMLKDGTIVLNLRAVSKGRIGEAQFRVEPSDPSYKNTLDHVEGLKPGEVKPVPPWPSDKDVNNGCVKGSPASTSDGR